MSKSSLEINEENERIKAKDNESKKTMMLKRNIQRVEDQGKRGKFKNVTTQITKELLDYIKANFEGYSLLVLSYIILGALISIRRLFLNAFLETDEFLNEKLGLAKTKTSKNLSRPKAKEINNILSNKELTAETLRTLFNKSLMSEFEKFKSSKINLSKDLFDKIQSTLYKMKIPTMIGVTEQDVLKFEEEKIINPLFKKLFTEPLPNKAVVQMVKDSQHDTQNFADLVGINVENIINKEGVLDNGQFFPDNSQNNNNNDYLDNNDHQLFQLLEQILASQILGYDDALLVDEHTRGDGAYVVQSGPLTLPTLQVAHLRPGHVQLLDGIEPRVTLVVERHADNLETPAVIVGIGLDNGGHLGTTGATP